MPHFKCAACNVRLYGAGGRGHRVVDLVGDLCPRCGSVLQPIGEPENTAHALMADRLRDVFAGRMVIDAQTWLDAERWLDDGGEFRADAPARARSQAGA